MAKAITPPESVVYEANTYPYEDLDIQFRLEGDWLLRLTTNLMIHRKHTKKDVFSPHSVFSVAVFTQVPPKSFVDDWLKKARQAALGVIEKGEYSDEIYMGGEWQSIARRFNSWFFWDKAKERKIVDAKAK